MSTGFLGEEKTGKWRVVRFNERKYIVFEPKPGSAELYVRQIGSANPIAQCKVAPEWGGGALHCSGREELDGYEKSAIHGDVSTWVLEYGAGNGHRRHTISRHRHLFRAVILRIRSPQVTVATDATTATGLLGWMHYGPGNANRDILPRIGRGDGATGFTGPLGPGTYSFWVQDFNSATYDFDLALAAAAAVPEPDMYAALVVGLVFLVAGLRRMCIGNQRA